MNFFKSAGGKLSAKRDMDIVTSFIKAELKTKLYSARQEKNNLGVYINFDNDHMLLDANKLLNSVINDYDEINKKTEQIKNARRSALGVPSLSDDEDYAIEIESIKDIKKAGLARPLTREERIMLKNATVRWGTIYSDTLKEFKSKEKLR